MAYHRQKNSLVQCHTNIPQKRQLKKDSNYQKRKLIKQKSSPQQNIHCFAT